MTRVCFNKCGFGRPCFSTELYTRQRSRLIRLLHLARTASDLTRPGMLTDYRDVTIDSQITAPPKKDVSPVTWHGCYVPVLWRIFRGAQPSRRIFIRAGQAIAVQNSLTRGKTNNNFIGLAYGCFQYGSVTVLAKMFQIQGTREYTIVYAENPVVAPSGALDPECVA